MDIKPLPTRRGRPLCITIDTDAEQLLRAMIPHSRGLGLFVAELIRKEAKERSERHKLLRMLGDTRPA